MGGDSPEVEGGAGTGESRDADAGASSTTGDGGPAVWSACFAPVQSVDTCEDHCAALGQHCATTCDTGKFTQAPQAAAALTWDGPACDCANPRCPAADRATGWGAVCGAAGFATDGSALPRASVRCCCAPGLVTRPPPQCDDLTTGMWVTEPEPSPQCGADGFGDHEELNFVEMPQPGVGPRVVQWACFDAALNARSSMSYELGGDGCSGALADGAFQFTIAGDLLTVHWGAEPREYRHAPDAAKRPGDPGLGI